MPPTVKTLAQSLCAAQPPPPSSPLAPPPQQARSLTSTPPRRAARAPLPSRPGSSGCRVGLPNPIESSTPQSPRSLLLINRRCPHSSPPPATFGLVYVSPRGWGGCRGGWQRRWLGSTQGRPAVRAARGWGRDTLFLPQPMGQASTFGPTSRQMGGNLEPWVVPSL
jgi:hypothetical protein